jgi:Flp pilus assembly protein TadD
MNRIAIAVLFLSMTAFLVGCNKRSDQPLMAATQSQPESTPAPQAAANTTAAVADSCFNASTQSKEQDRIERGVYYAFPD